MKQARVRRLTGSVVIFFSEMGSRLKHPLSLWSRRISFQSEKAKGSLLTEES